MTWPCHPNPRFPAPPPPSPPPPSHPCTQPHPTRPRSLVRACVCAAQEWLKGLRDSSSAAPSPFMLLLLFGLARQHKLEAPIMTLLKVGRVPRGDGGGGGEGRGGEGLTP